MILQRIEAKVTKPCATILTLYFNESHTIISIFRISIRIQAFPKPDPKRIPCSHYDLIIRIPNIDPMITI